MAWPRYKFEIFLCLASVCVCTCWCQVSLENLPKCTRPKKIGEPCLLQKNCSVSLTNSTNEVQTNVTNCQFHIYYSTFNTTKAIRYSKLHKNEEIIKLSTMAIWAYSFGSSFVISLSGVCGLFLVPVLNSPYRQHALNVLVGLSFGSLLTTATFHLIPEAYNLPEFMPNYLNIAVFTLVSIWSILLLQNLLTIASHKPEEEILTYKQCNGKSSNEKISSLLQIELNANEAIGNGYKVCGNGEEKYDNKKVENDVKLLGAVEVREEKIRMKSLIFMVVLGDSLHNLMDGVSIGAGYSHSLTTGITLTIAIACEEYPHELGDFAILLQSGMRIYKALIVNYCTACSCFIGTVIGITLGELQWAPQIFSFSNGLFLYTSVSLLIPELRREVHEELLKSKKAAMIALLEQNVGTFLGFLILCLIS